MGRGAWWATVYGVTELDMTEGLTRTQPTHRTLPLLSDLREVPFPEALSPSALQH